MKKVFLGLFILTFTSCSLIVVFLPHRIVNQPVFLPENKKEHRNDYTFFITKGKDFEIFGSLMFNNWEYDKSMIKDSAYVNGINNRTLNDFQMDFKILTFHKKPILIKKLKAKLYNNKDSLIIDNFCFTDEEKTWKEKCFDNNPLENKQKFIDINKYGSSDLIIKMISKNRNYFYLDTVSANVDIEILIENKVIDINKKFELIKKIKTYELLQHP